MPLRQNRSATVNLRGEPEPLALLLTPIGEPADLWVEAFRAELPGVEIRLWPDVGDRRSIEYAVVGSLPPGELARLPRLRLIASLFAGQDLLLSDEMLPPAVPIVRTDNPDGDPMMSEFVVLHVLRHHRHMPAYAMAQSRREWRQIRQPRAGDRRVGIMGLGPIGLGAARALRGLGFAIAGWTRRAREEEGIETFHGRAQFPAFLARSEIIVNLLPLTPQTEDILDATAFAMLPRGASVINLGRGQHLVDEDLLGAIATGHIVAATLDVFRIEPLPAESHFWTNPAITVTPHVARRLDVEGIARRVAEQVRRLDEGRPLENLVDRVAGY